ncbi:MAG: hypothetical protein ACRDB1_04445 [Microcoleaceae cyanobacterium]
MTTFLSTVVILTLFRFSGDRHNNFLYLPDFSDGLERFFQDF